MSELTAAEETLTLRPEGIFDIPAAWRMREALLRLPPAAHVTLDFSALRECHDFALAALLQALAMKGGLILKTQGLRQHQRRLLAYLGMEKDSPALEHERE